MSVVILNSKLATVICKSYFNFPAHLVSNITNWNNETFSVSFLSNALHLLRHSSKSSPSCLLDDLPCVSIKFSKEMSQLTIILPLPNDNNWTSDLLFWHLAISILPFLHRHCIYTICFQCTTTVSIISF